MKLSVFLCILLTHLPLLRAGTVPPSSPESTPALDSVALSFLTYNDLVRLGPEMIARADADAATVFFQHLREDRRPHNTPADQWHAIANEWMGEILRRGLLGGEIETQLVRVVREAGDIVIRDYALQHLAMLADPAKPGPALQLLTEAAGWKDSPLSGTAIVNLVHLHEDPATAAGLADLALALAADPAAHEASRSSALQVGVLLGDKRFLEPAVDLARRSPIVAHRVSALRVISILGGPEQRPLLLQLRRRGPEPVTALANAALAKFP
jgi:hypothetical protein